MRSTWRIGFASACLIATLAGESFARQSSAPKKTPARPASWERLNEQAMSLYKAEKLDEARSMLTQALAAAEKERGPESSSVAQVLNEIGYLDNVQKKYTDAELRLLRSAAIVEKLAGKENGNLASIYQGLGSSYAGQGKYSEAETAYLHALAIGEKSFGHDDPKLVPILQGYAWTLRKMGQNERAMAMDARVSLIRGEPTPSPPAPANADSASAASVPAAPSFEDARTAYARGDVAGAVKMFRELAEQGNPHAQAVLGDLYMNGQGVPKDVDTAIQWYRKSAEQGFPGGQVNLGVCYEKGLGVKKDLAEALRWYRKAADQNFADAQRFVGDMYAKGLGVPKDWQEAERWYAKAAAGGDAQAANLMKVPESGRREAFEKAWNFKGSAMDVALRAVALQGEIWTLRWAVPKGVRVTLGTEVVTAENGREVLARLEKDRSDLDEAMAKVGAPDLTGEYLLNEPAKDKCAVFESKRLVYPVKVTIAQNRNSIELKSSPFNGCGVVIDRLLVLSAQPCEGTSPRRILAAVSANGIDDLTLLESADAPTSCRLGDLRKAK